MVTVLGIDGGQSGSRLQLRLPDGAVVSWRDAGIPPGMTPRQAMTGPLLDSVVRKVSDAELDRPTVVGAGLTGFHGGAADAAEVLDVWSDALGVRRLSLTDDAVSSYLGALGDTSGVVVAAGTGVTVLASNGAGCVRVNGWGPTLGDEGGGYWIGQEGLRSAYRWLDGRGGSERLATAAREAFGTLTELPGTLAASADRVGMIASFSRHVAAAAHDLDPEATRIWSDAGHELATAALAALRRLDDGGAQEPGPAAGAAQISWNGSLFEAGELLSGPFRQAIRAAMPDARIVGPRADALHGALELTRRDTITRFGALIDTAEIGRDSSC